MVSRAYTYALTHADQVLTALIGHLWLVGVPVGIGLGIGLPLGLLSARAGGLPDFNPGGSDPTGDSESGNFVSGDSLVWPGV